MSSLIFTTSEGHLSIAKSLESFLSDHERHGKIVFREEPWLETYKVFYKYAPSVFTPFFHLSKTKLADTIAKKYLLSEHQKFVEREIKKEQAKTVFSTSFGFNEAITFAKKKYPFLFVNVLANPRTFFVQDLAPADVTCVFDENMKRQVQHVFPKNEVITTGWFVQPQFKQPHDKLKSKQDIGVDDNQLCFLFVTGSEGTQSVVQLIEETAQIPHIQLIVACGNNHHLFSKMKALAKESLATLHVLPFTKEIYKYMQAADLVIGKGGPNMLFESIATHTPFFATTHIGGLEDGNLDIIREYQVGFVEENSEKAIKKIRALVEHPDKLVALQPHVSALANYNNTQKDTLLQFLK